MICCFTGKQYNVVLFFFFRHVRIVETWFIKMLIELKTLRHQHCHPLTAALYWFFQRESFPFDLSPLSGEHCGGTNCWNMENGDNGPVQHCSPGPH